VASKGDVAELARPSARVDAITEEDEENEDEASGNNKKEQQKSAREAELEARALAAETEMQRMREVMKCAC